MSKLIQKNGRVASAGTEPESRLMQVTGGEDKPKVLVVEDYEAIRRSYRRTLEEEGYSVAEASNGGEGLEKFTADESISVVLTDYSMPGMNGDEMSGKIKNHAEEHDRKAGIILIAAQQDEVMERLRADPNIDAVLNKPPSRKDILDNVARLHKQTQ